MIPKKKTPWWRTRWMVLLHDVAWVPLVIWLTYQLRFDFRLPANFLLHPPMDWQWDMRWLIGLAIVLQAIVSWFFGLYRGMWRFASLPDMVRILKAVLVGTAVFFTTAFLLFGKAVLPRSILLLYPLLLTFFLIAPRLGYRWWKNHRIDFRLMGRKRVLIAGAGRAGELLVRNMLYHPDYRPVVMLDDDPEKLGKEIHGVQVKGQISDLPNMVARFDAEIVFLAMPSVGRSVVTQVVHDCSNAGISCRTLPSLRELADGQVEVSRLRPITVEDLLGREPVRLDDAVISACLQGQCVLVTGGGGSIGSELCRQVARLNPSALVILEHGEFNLYAIEQDLRREFPELLLHGVLGDVKDLERVEWTFHRYQPRVIFHAAAYKHVPILEANPAEGILNNVFGSKVVADAAHRHGCERLVMISTDKAVNPTNVMGASKRIAELYCQTLGQRSSTRFITVRFGNVLGSTGSVVPLFRQQIDRGGPVTITHPDITRYFMTIPEAVGLVLQAGTMGKGGEIFVLDMGEPVRIRDLAEQMILLSGLVPGVDIPIDIIGLRPGEKLYEELFYATEDLQPTHHPKIRLAQSQEVAWDWLARELIHLKTAAVSREPGKILAQLQTIVTEFHPQDQEPLG